MVTINVSLGSGADERASTGLIKLRPVVELKVGNFLALAEWDDYSLGVEPVLWNLTEGALYEAREVVPRGKTRVFQAPLVTTDYKDLDWLTEVPSSGGGYVIEPTVTEFTDATGEPDIDVGDYWIATNPDHPDFGYLMQKGS